MKKILITLIIIVCSFSSKAQESKIIGNWQLTTVVSNGETETGLKAVFIFDATGVLKGARDAHSKSMKVGTWEYNKKKKLIVMTSTYDKDFNGEASVIKLNNKELIYKKDSFTLSFIKLEKLNSPAIITLEKPILSFETEDFYHSENGFDEELEAEKLPWKIIDVVNYLKDEKEVVFQLVSFPETREADTWVVSTKINYNKEEKTIGARDYSYFQKDYIDMVEQAIPVDYLEENKEDFRFFPEEGLDYYKVISTQETIKTSIGNLTCTVVEGIGNGRPYTKAKYWMVNDQPGIFAKIIGVKDGDPAPFCYTKVFTLKEIK